MMYDEMSTSSSKEILQSKTNQSSLQTVLSRLNFFIEQETEEIGSNKKFDFKASSEKKSRLLFELNKASRLADHTSMNETLISELQRLRKALKINEAKIRIHLSALRDVSDILVNIIKDENTDGTYSNLG